MTRLSYSSLHTDPYENNKCQDLPNAQNQALVQCYGYKGNSGKLFAYYAINIFLIGIPYLIGRWCAQWKVYFTCVPTFLRNATVVLIKDDDEYFTCNVLLDPIDFLPDEFTFQKNDLGSTEPRASSATPLNSSIFSKPIFRHFSFRHETFFWDDTRNGFRKLEGLQSVTCTDLLEYYSGLSHSKRIQLKMIYGPNLIDVEVKGYGKLLFEEVLNPFYVFQIFSITLWCFDNYYYYAACVVIISFISITIALVETRKQLEMLHEMARGSDDFLVSVRPSGEDSEELEICVRDLVPGDVILVPPEGFIMPCDAVVTSGTCIVNESMLTGESIPVRKSPIHESKDYFDAEVHKRHTLFAGTHVIQTRFYGGNKISCVVVRTGFSTLKGNLIRSMMFPKQTGLDFYQDSVRFVLLLFVVALCGMCYCAFIYISRQASWHVLLVRVLDVVTIAVPPALPAALTVGTVYAQGRLKLKQIFCISPPKINFCGKLQLICFDKTGTLTEDGLDFSCVMPVEENSLGNSIFGEAVYDVKTLPVMSELLRGMASCHSLTHIKGNLVGDPLDLKMFEATGWELVEPLNNQDEKRYDLLMPSFVRMNDVEIGIIREFEFTPQLQRMSVVVRALDSPAMMLYCKGSPEKVSSLCSNLPADYDLMLDSFTVKGFRVLALSRKVIHGLPWHQVQRGARVEIEKDMIFSGFLVMQNSLKPVTIKVIRELKAAELRSVMVTGDNALTALSVARECGMIPTCDKVVLVNATEDGEIEYTLAAHHYETEDSTRYDHESHSRRVSTTSHSRKVSSTTRRSISSENEDLGSLDENNSAVFTESSNYRSIMNTDGDETRIDIDRLIPITTDAIHLESNFVTIDSNYHFVVTGKSWDILCRCHPKSTLDRIIAKGTVYARMSPEWKSQLVESLQNIGYVVGMVGDGANDCSALTMAHVGISLSEAEASVAAPFTSKIPDISCVPHLIREGRCALVTSFGMFKYMALYSLVQFISVLSLYRLGSNLADPEFLYIDLVITTTLAVVMGRTEPYTRIVAKRPIGSLSSVQNVISIVCQIIISALIQVLALNYLQAQPWYIQVHPTSGDDVEKLCWENTTIFSVSAFQYLILALVFSKGPPFRKPFYTNVYFIVALLILTAITIIITIHPFSWISNFMGLMPLSPATNFFRYTLLFFPLVNLIASLAIEAFLTMGGLVKNKLGSLGLLRKNKAKYKYQEILNQIDIDVTWPRVKCS